MNYEAILEIYSLEELIELNSLSLEEVLEFLVQQEFIKLPVV